MAQCQASVLWMARVAHCSGITQGSLCPSSQVLILLSIVLPPADVKQLSGYSHKVAILTTESLKEVYLKLHTIIFWYMWFPKGLFSQSLTRFRRQNTNIKTAYLSGGLPNVAKRAWLFRRPHSLQFPTVLAHQP